jgi:hypothetical protein
MNQKQKWLKGWKLKNGAFEIIWEGALAILMIAGCIGALIVFGDAFRAHVLIY